MSMDVSAIQSGWDVFGSDGDKVGDVSEVGPNYVLVTKGFLFTKDIYVPTSAITGVEQDRVYLNVAKGQVEGMGWDQPPTDSGAAYGTDTGVSGTTPGYGSGAATMGDADDVTTTTQSTTTDTSYVQQPAQPTTQYVEQPAQPAARVSDDETLRVQRYEEELQAQTVEREAGSVRVTKDVEEEQRTLEVPTAHEEVEIHSVTVDRAATDTGEAFQGGAIEVPLTEQDVEVRKEVRVAEELEIEKRAVEETETVTDTVRKERVDVEEVGDVDVERDTQPDADVR